MTSHSPISHTLALTVTQSGLNTMEEKNRSIIKTEESTFINPPHSTSSHNNNTGSSFAHSSPYFQTTPLPPPPSSLSSLTTNAMSHTVTTILEGEGEGTQSSSIQNTSLNNSLKVNHAPQSNGSGLGPSGSGLGSLATQLCPLGPKDRCTPSQAQAMGQQILSLMVAHENNKMTLPYELQNTFDIFHRCLAVAYGTFFLHLYTKANAPCLLCHGCKSLYPPGQYIHHSCPALPPNIVPCRSRMWRRCLVPLVSQDIDKTQQKERWRFVLEKFSHNNMGVVRRNKLPAELNLLDMPECKRGRFVKLPSNEPPPITESDDDIMSALNVSLDHNNEVGEVTSDVGVANNGVSMANNGQQSIGGSLLMTNNTILLEQDDDIVDDFEDHTHSPPIATIQPVPPILEEQQQQQILQHRQHETPPTSQITPPTSLKGGGATHKAFELVSQLVTEIKRLEGELETSQNKLQFVEKQLHTIAKSSNISEQLVHSLIAQDKLTLERDQALERAKQAEEKVTALQEHIQKIQKLQNEVLKSTSL